MHRTCIAVLLVLCAAASTTLAGVTFKVTVEPYLTPKPVSSRLIISVIGPNSKLASKTSPNDSPFWDDPDQPMFGLDIQGLAGDHPVTLGDAADTRTIKPSQLPPGEYRAAARLITTHLTSNWKYDPGNLYSTTVKFTIPKPEAGKNASDQEVEIKLNAIIKLREWPKTYTEAGAEYFEVKSKLLSEFRGRDVVLRAGVVKPVDFDPKMKYAAIYEVPGFGGDHLGAIGPASRRLELASAETRKEKPGAELILAQSTFHIVLDPESPNGHTLFADSANNGPCGRALVEELIPALEAKYPLIAKPEARLLRGHSSGGWSTLWLALNYPQTFGATWSSSPDPVDFERLEVVNIYRQLSIYTNSLPREDAMMDRAGLGLAQIPQALVPPLKPGQPEEIVSSRGGGKPGMSIRQESGNEDILGPDNTSGQQWDSWFAVWGPRNAAGHPAALFDPKSGVIDHAIAEQYRKYDIADLLRKQPEKYGPIFQNRVRLVVGDWDNFFLNEAVTLLKQDVDKLPKPTGELKPVGYITIVPKADHGSVFESPAIRAFPSQMLDHLKAHDAMPIPTKAESK